MGYTRGRSTDEPMVYIPRGYRRAVASPLILALHGGGERGGDGQLQTDVGLGTALRKYADRYPAIVVFPQTPLDATWQGLGTDEQRHP